MSEVASTARSVKGWEWITLAALLLLGFVLRCTVIGQYESTHPLADRPVIDEASYEDWALEISRGDWMGEEVFFQEPLYPYWMATVFAVFGESRTSLRTVQAGLGVLTVFLVWALTRRLFGVNPALLAALALATYRPALLLPSLLLKPNLFLPILAGMAWVLVAATQASGTTTTKRALLRWLLVGGLAGLGALLRGNMLLLLPAFAVWPAALALIRRASFSKSLPACAAILAGALLILAPVALRNHHVGGVWALTTSGAGTNVYGGNNSDNPYGLAREFDWVRGIPEFEAEDWKHEAERRLGRELDPTEVSSYWLAQVGESILADPAMHLSILWNKLRLTLGSYEVPDNHHLEWDARFVPLLRAPLPGYDLWGWLGLAGLLLFLSELSARIKETERMGGVALALFYLAYLGTIVLTVTSMRARLALLPLLLPFAGEFVGRLARGFREREFGRLAAVVLLSALMVYVPVFDATERAMKLATRELNELTYRFQELGASEALLADIDELDQRYPNTLRVWSLHAEVGFGLARAEAGEGNVDGMREYAKAARSRLETVIEVAGTNERERHRARVLLGDLASFIGVPTAARVHYERALEFDPTDAHVRRGLAEALLILALDYPEDEAFLLLQSIDEFEASLRLDHAEPGSRLLGLANAEFQLALVSNGEERAEFLKLAETHLLQVQATGESSEVSQLLELVRKAQ